MAWYSEIWNLASLLVGGLIGFLSSFITSNYMYNKKEKDEMCQRVYAPLRFEIASNMQKAWEVDEKFTKKEWNRIYKEEHLFYKIEPTKLQDKVAGVFEVEFHNFSAAITAARNAAIIEIKKNTVKGKPVYDDLFIDFANDILTYEQKLHLWRANNSFNILKKQGLVKHKSYAELREKMLEKFKRSQHLNHFWKQRKQFYSELQGLLAEVESKLKIKNEMIKVK